MGVQRGVHPPADASAWLALTILPPRYPRRTRESAIQRRACMSAAGPRYLSMFHQYEGHEVLQHAHRMHSYMPSCAKKKKKREDNRHML